MIIGLIIFLGIFIFLWFFGSGGKDSAGVNKKFGNFRN